MSVERNVVSVLVYLLLKQGLNQSRDDWDYKQHLNYAMTHPLGYEKRNLTGIFYTQRWTLIETGHDPRP